MGKKTQVKGVLLLLLTAMIWGSSFVAQSIGMERIEAFTFNGIRTWMGAIVLVPVILFRDWTACRTMTEEEKRQWRQDNIKTIRSGIPVGLALFVASSLQQFAFNYSTSGKIAFITALYMFFVPLLGLFIGKRVPFLTWICVAMGFVGLLLLCINPEDMTAINRGDFLAFLCAIGYAVHILVIEKKASNVDGVKLSFMQFVVCAFVSTVCMFVFEQPSLAAVRSAILPLLYSGVMSCGLAYTFQIVAQKYTESTVASLLMCMESVFGALSGAIILHELLNGREILGCCIMFGAILLSQVSELLTEKLKDLHRHS